VDTAVDITNAVATMNIAVLMEEVTPMIIVMGIAAVDTNAAAATNIAETGATLMMIGMSIAETAVTLMMIGMSIAETAVTLMMIGMNTENIQEVMAHNNVRDCAPFKDNHVLSGSISRGCDL
jgi:hypothetical protein